MLKKIRQFGARVIGEQREQEEKAKEQAQVSKFGPLVLGTKVITGTNTPAPDSKPVKQAPLKLLSIKNLQAMVDKNPASARGLFLDEMRREEGPRLGALQVLYGSAVKREATELAADIDLEIRRLKGEPVDTETEGEETPRADEVPAVPETEE